MRTESELRALLGEHVDWLRASAARFDEGVVSESKRIALAVRTLVHDSGSATSLLTQLGMRDRMTWLSCVGLDRDGFARPPWIDQLGFAPMLNAPQVETDFATWWRGALLTLPDAAITREWIVRSVANVDGGAHVDPDIPLVYGSITREGGLEPVRINSEGERYTDSSNPIPSALRTICTEVVLSVERAW